jgi:hypothetical protein
MLDGVIKLRKSSVHPTEILLDQRQIHLNLCQFPMIPGDSIVRGGQFQAGF